MAGLTDTVYRKLIRKYTKDCLLTTEMLSSEAIIHNQKGNILKYEEFEKPLSFQLSGHKPDVMARAARFLNDFATVIDINMGCPVNKIVKGSDGSGLMKTPDLACDIVKAVKDAVDVPVTVKTRLGWDFDHINFVEFAQMLETAGADAITIHGRTRSQMYSGNANWEILSNLKGKLNVPLVANGDIDSPQNAEKCLNLAMADAIAIARPSIGNPDLLFRVDNYLKTGELRQKMSLKEKMENLIEHLEGEMSLRGKLVGIKFMRKFYAYYINSFANASNIRQKLIVSEDLDEIMSYINEIRNRSDELMQV